MRIIRNSYIPFRGFTAMNLLGVLFVRREAAELTPETLNHEKIHSAQMREMLYIPFYIWYLLEWILRLFLPGMPIAISLLSEHINTKTTSPT